MKPKAYRIHSGLLLGAFFATATAASQAALVFHDDFESPTATALAGRAPNVGNAWTEGAYQVSGGVLDTATGNSGDTAFGGFTAALGVGQTLTLTYTTTAFSFGSPWGGVSLLTTIGGPDSDERIFTGDLGGLGSNSFWGTVVQGETTGTNGATEFLSDDTTAATTVTFTYEFDSGAWSFATSSGVGFSGTTTSGWALDRVRVGQGGSNFTVSELSVDVIPEPSAALLSLLGLGAVLRRRR